MKDYKRIGGMQDYKRIGGMNDYKKDRWNEGL